MQKDRQFFKDTGQIDEGSRWPILPTPVLPRPQRHRLALPAEKGRLKKMRGSEAGLKIRTFRSAPPINASPTPANLLAGEAAAGRATAAISTPPWRGGRRPPWDRYNSFAPPEPRTPDAGCLWRWDALQSLLDRAAREYSLDDAERRVLTPLNPLTRRGSAPPVSMAHCKFCCRARWPVPSSLPPPFASS